MFKSSDKKRACIITYSFYEYDNRVKRETEALLHEGFSIDVISLASPLENIGVEKRRNLKIFKIQKREKDEKKPFDYIRKISLFFIKTSFLLTFLHSIKRYKLIHIHSTPDFLVFTALIPKIFGAKVILDIHDVLPELYSMKFKRDKGSLWIKIMFFIERVSAKFADHVIVANEMWRRRIENRSIGNAKSTCVVNLPEPTLFNSKKRHERKEDSKFIISYHGSLTNYHGVDIAINAIKELKSSINGLELQIIGEGSYKKELKELVQKLNLSDIVKFLGSFQIEKIPDKISRADIGIAPKKQNIFTEEALSTKIFEYLALGIPVIASRIKIEEYYFDDSIIIFFEPDNPNDLAKKILYLYENPKIRKEYSIKGLQFSAKHSWYNEKKKFLDVVERTINSNQRFSSHK